jgi:aryl-alcohol dehydrogenase-like predicted oxidoreductase
MTTTLGPTGLEVSRIGLGLAALGRPAYINVGHAADLAGQTDVEALERVTHNVLDAAYAGGVRYFDAARSYGQAEAFLADWLRARGLGPTDVTVGSKWGYTYTGEWRLDAPVNEVKELSLPNLRRQWAESSELLARDLRLYQVHSATLASGVLDDRGVIDQLRRLRAGGVAIGLTVTGPEQGETIEKALEVGIFDCVQGTWNLLERSAGPALAAAHAAGAGVIVKEALANGRLAARGDVKAVAEVARLAGATPDALALAVVLAQPWVDVVLSGAAAVGEIESNLAALSVDVSPEVVQRLDGIQEDRATYWRKRATLPWS